MWDDQVVFHRLYIRHISRQGAIQPLETGEP